MSSSKLSSNLKRRAIAWAGQLTKLSRQYAPNHLKPFIKSRVEEKEDGHFRIVININKDAKPAGPESNYKNGSSDAFAQEFGSGIRTKSKAGIKRKIPIKPKIKKVLAFNWQIANQNPERFNFSPDGRVLLGGVESPGIYPANNGKGYLGIAVDGLLTRGLKELDDDIRKAIVDDLSVSFKNAKK